MADRYFIIRWENLRLIEDSLKRQWPPLAYARDGHCLFLKIIYENKYG